MSIYYPMPTIKPSERTGVGNSHQKGHTMRKSHVSTTARKCVGCGMEISAGVPFWVGLTGESWHKSCKRLGVTPRRSIPQRFKTDDPVGKACGACDLVIYDDDVVVFKMARPFHKECAIRM